VHGLSLLEVFGEHLICVEETKDVLSDRKAVEVHQLDLGLVGWKLSRPDFLS